MRGWNISCLCLSWAAMQLAATAAEAPLKQANAESSPPTARAGKDAVASTKRPFATADKTEVSPSQRPEMEEATGVSAASPAITPQSATSTAGAEAAFAPGQQPPQTAAVAGAFSDASRAVSPQTLRYLWFPDDKADDVLLAATIAVNTVLNRNSVAAKLPLVAPKVRRVDLATLARNADDLQKLIEAWELFAKSEPYFLQPVVLDDTFLLLADTQLQVGGNVLTTIPAGTRVKFGEAKDGTAGSQWLSVTYGGQTGYISADAKRQPVSKTTDREFGIHAGAEALPLGALTASQVPIVRADWFVNRSLSCINGGTYYELRGIEPSADKAVSDFDAFLQKFVGVSEDVVEKLDSDSRVAMRESRVTGSVRTVVAFRGPQSKIHANQGLVAITYDPEHGDPNTRVDAFRHLLQPGYAAMEVFVELPSGHIAYALFTGDKNGDGKYDPDADEGELQREAPQTVVSDRTVPAPHPTRLTPGISCMSCHSVQEGKAWADGWREAPNEILQMITPQGGVVVDILSDLDAADGGVARLASLYTGDWSIPFFRARSDLSEAVRKLLTGPVPDGHTPVSHGHGTTVAVYNRYTYVMVSPEAACAELGITVPDGKLAAATLAAALPPIDIGGVLTEDVWIASLKQGRDIPKLNWEVLYHTAINRVIYAQQPAQQPAQ